MLRGPEVPEVGGPDELAWDVAFLAWGAGMVLVGSVLGRESDRL